VGPASGPKPNPFAGWARVGLWALWALRKSSDKSLVFGERAHSVSKSETEEKREGRSAGAEVPAFIPLGVCQSGRSKL
jgi:hypothetical protein